MPKKAKPDKETSLPESDEYLRELELLKRICRNEASLEIKMREAREPLYLVRS